MNTKRFLFALSALASCAVAAPVQAHDHHHDSWRHHHQVVYQNYHHYGYYRPVYRPVVPIAPVIVVRP